MEFSFLPTLPAIAGKEPLYLAEGVAALVKVKSNLAKEWEDVQRKASTVKNLRRQFWVPGFTPFGPPPEQIPYLAVGHCPVLFQSSLAAWLRAGDGRRLALVTRNAPCYTGIMIIGFKHKGLERFFTRGSKAGVQAKHADRLRLILGRLHASTCPQDMNLPGLGFHPLAGDRQGYSAVKVSGNWRITFRFLGKDADAVDYEDYH